MSVSRTITDSTITFIQATDLSGGQRDGRAVLFRALGEAKAVVIGMADDTCVKSTLQAVAFTLISYSYN